MSIRVKNNFEILFKKWIVSGELQAKSGDVELLLNVDEETEAPVVLRAVAAYASQGSVIIILPQLSRAESMFEVLPLWSEISGINIRPVLLPETSISNQFIPENEHLRCNALYKASTGDATFFIASAAAITSAVPPPEYYISNSLTIKKGPSVGLKKIIEELLELDYDDEI